MNPVVSFAMTDKVISEKAASKLYWGDGRVAFIAQQAQIKSMLAEGYSQSAIYKLLQEHLSGMSYSQFSYLIRKNIARIPKTSDQSLKETSIAPGQKSQTTELNSMTAFRSFQPGPKVPDINDLF
jgi:Family of unknown function (DUF5338)